MVNPQVGYQPRTTPAERRAFFELQRQLKAIEVVEGPQGEPGPAGATGPTGAPGATGAGVATGGTTGQILAKNSATDYDTGWVNPVKLARVCQVSRTSHSYPNNSLLAASWDTDDLDPYNWHSTSVDTDRVTPNVTGWYRLHVVWQWDADTDYIEQFIQFTKNGAAITGPEQGDHRRPTTANHIARQTATSSLISMNGSTDYVGLQARQQNSSAGVNTGSSRFLVELVYTP